MVKNRIKYIDTLKCISIFGVIFLHCFVLWKSMLFMGINFYNFNQLGRFAVPTFLMVSGALLLNKDIEVGSYIKRRFVRICYPLLFFIIIAYIFGLYPNPFVAFWYCWMILGAYLSIPIINIFIKNASMKEIEYFIILFLLTSISYQLFSISKIEFSIDLNFFISPISFLIVGYYLSKREFNMSANKIVLISAILFTISTFLKMKSGNAFYIYPKINMYSTLDFSFLQIIQTSSIFLMFKFIYQDVSGIFSRIKNILLNKTVDKAILSISRASYGMYLVHMIFLKAFIRPFFKPLKLTGFQMVSCSLTLFISLALVSWLITIILGKIPYLDKISGYY